MLDNEPITIEITQEEIDRGVRSSPTCCPGALAVLKAVAPPECLKSIDRLGFFVSVNSCRVTFAGATVPQRRYCTPIELLRFMVRYDRGMPVEPIKFKLQELAPESYGYPRTT